MVLIDILTRWSHFSLFSNHGVAFDRFLVQIIRLKVQFLDFPIKKLDLITPMNLHQFPNFYIKKLNLIMLVNLHLKSLNGLAEFLTKRLQLIAKQLILRSNLPFSCWGHAILHAASLICIPPSSYHTYSPSQLVFSQQINFSHLKICGCVVYVLIAPVQRNKTGLQQRIRIYVGFQSPSTIRYVKPLIGDIFTTWFTNCHFGEQVFPLSGGTKTQIS